MDRRVRKTKPVESRTGTVDEGEEYSRNYGERVG